MADLNNAVVWMVSTHLISNSSGPCPIPLVIVPISGKIFTSALADGLSLESEGRQISSDLQDSGRS